MRALLAFSLAILVAFTSQSLAVARGQAVASGQMVICSGGQVVTVSVDAEGNPVGPAHVCPDCALHVLDLSPEAPVPGFVPVCTAQRLALAQTPWVHGPPAVTPRARAPPLNV